MEIDVSKYDRFVDKVIEKQDKCKIYDFNDMSFGNIPDEWEKPSYKIVSNWKNADDMADEARPPDYMIDNIIESRTHGIISGSSQSFKSFCVLKMAHSICTGTEFFGHEVFTSGPVLYICGEGMGALERRVRALKIVEGGFDRNLIVKNRPLSIDNIADMDWLRLEIDKIRPVLAIFDTFSSLATSTKENVNEEVARALRMVSDCCSNTGTSSIIVHHYGKDVERGSRGASAFSANVDYELSMARDVSTMQARLTCKKSKDGDFFEEIAMTAHIVDLGMKRQNGRPVTSLVLKQVEGIDKLTDRQKIAYDAIRELVSTCGFIFEDKLCVSESMIKSMLIDLFADDGRSRYGLFGRLIPAILKKGILLEKSSNYWLA